MSQPFLAQTSELFVALWERQNGVCALCGEPLLQNRFQAPHARIWVKRRATFDHILPRSKGGRDEASNFQLAHAHCNKVKGNRL